MRTGSSLCSLLFIIAGLGAPSGAGTYAAGTIRADPAFALHPSSSDTRIQTLPVAAYDGRGRYLVAWQQGLNYYGWRKADIRAARVATDGRVLDGDPIVVTRHAETQERPQVIRLDDAFLVVWQDFRSGRKWAVYGARITRDGRLLDPEGFVIGEGDGGHSMPALASAPGGALVVWQAFGKDRLHRLHAAVVDREANVQHRGPLRYAGADSRQWQGYTPGWGFGQLPLRIGIDDAEVVYGGGASVAALNDGWLLSWNDDSNWAPGNPGTTTRRFARLERWRDGWAVVSVGRAPAVPLGRSGGVMIGNESGEAAFAGWGIAGRGHRVVTGVKFSANGAMSPNPNDEPRFGGSGWDTGRMIPLFSPTLPMDGPVAAAFGLDVLLVAARGADISDPPHSQRILGSRLDLAGVRLDGPDNWPVLHEGQVPAMNPFLTAGQNAFLLVFEQDQGPGQRRVWASMLRLE